MPDSKKLQVWQKAHEKLPPCSVDLLDGLLRRQIRKCLQSHGLLQLVACALRLRVLRFREHRASFPFEFQQDRGYFG